MCLSGEVQYVLSGEVQYVLSGEAHVILSGEVQYVKRGSTVCCIVCCSRYMDMWSVTIVIRIWSGECDYCY